MSFYFKFQFQFHQSDILVYCAPIYIGISCKLLEFSCIYSFPSGLRALINCTVMVSENYLSLYYDVFAEIVGKDFYNCGAAVCQVFGTFIFLLAEPAVPILF